jgi:hypothetical protein
MDANIDFSSFPPLDSLLTLDYFPTEEFKLELKGKFRFWHTESLLNQSATLIDQCLKDLIQLKQLEALEFNLKQEIANTEKELEIQEKKIDYLARDSILTQCDWDYYDKRHQYSVPILESAKSASYVARDFITNDKQREIANYEANILFNEKNIEFLAFKNEIKKNVLQKSWVEDDKVKNQEFLDFRKQQLVVRKTQLDKTRALDFSYQKELCLKRLTRNYEDCLNRAVIAEDGLSFIYGYSDSLSSRLLVSDDLQFKITELHNWIYECIVHLTAYSQLDQSFTVCLSLKSLLSANDFHHLTTQTETFNINFLVDKSYFPTGTHQNIRFKGIGASLVGKVGIIPWKIEISLPRKAVYLRNADDFEIDQTDVPTCILGRVENRNSFRSVEYGGVISLNNLSPIAADGAELPNRWSIIISKPKSDVEKFQNLEDVVIELNLTGKLL